MSDSTLEPPGSIAVIGAGPLGIEAALYGRFLGYDVKLIEAEAVGHNMSDQRDLPLPMLPDRCLSPMSVSAINAQNPESPPFVLPTTIGQWIDEALVQLTETDLLRGRLVCPARVIAIEHLPVTLDSDVKDSDAVDSDTDQTSDDGEDVPPDFRLTFDDADPIDAEAVVLAVGGPHNIQFGFDLPAEYLFQVGESPSGDAEKDFLNGLRQIVGIYAQLADRKNLDLYAKQLPPPAV